MTITTSDILKSQKRMIGKFNRLFKRMTSKVMRMRTSKAVMIANTARSRPEIRLLIRACPNFTKTDCKPTLWVSISRSLVNPYSEGNVLCLDKRYHKN